MNKKSAFTLIEIIIVMAIVGIITAIGVSTFSKHSVDMRYIYYNVYHSLDKAIYNAMTYTNLPSPFVDFDERNKQLAVSPEQQVSRLCNMLIEYITTSSSSCNLEDNVITTGNNEDFQNVLPYFTAVNGVRFYISQRFTGGEPEHKFFIVFADLNGTKQPNSLHYERGIADPDIFAFAVLDIGRVCPLGPPEIDEKYLLTRIRYIDNTNNNDDGFHNIAFSEPSRPYFVSKAEAWGLYLPDGRGSLCNSSGQNCTSLPQDFLIEENPYTYNEYVRSALLSSGSELLRTIYENVPTMWIALWAVPGENYTSYEEETEETIQLRNGNNHANRGYGCKKGSDDECQIIIDKYAY